jgi:transposase InsO family protein
MGTKEALIQDVAGGMTVAEAAARHGVVRSCAYKWVSRYDRYGKAGLEELSRRPEHSPMRKNQELVDELLELKDRYGYGAEKLADLLEIRHGVRVMAASTAATLLERHGRVKKRRNRRSSVGRIEHSPYAISGAGDSMTVDYKGQFRMGNGRLCYPLTVADPFSRYLLGMTALGSTHMAPAKVAFERIFREHGVPRQIISDNGTPFTSAGSLGGLTQLSRWWIELGITPVRIAPGRPDQNAIHERMHRTFKDWIRKHPHLDLIDHQRSFDVFRHEFNQIRPHKGLGRATTPASMFKSYRPFPRRLVVEYDRNITVRKVNANGEIKWRGRLIFLSEVLIGAHVGFTQVAENLWSITYGHVRIGYLDTLNHRALNRRPGDR